MNVLKQLKECKVQADSLMELNQKTFIRDDKKKPVGITWTIEDHTEMFVQLYNLQNQLRNAIDSIRHIY